MGSRYYSYHKCPNCGKDYELYDAPSSLMYIGVCEHCSWSEPKDYYETGEHEISLMTPEEYQAWEKKTGRKAFNMMTPEEFDAYFKAHPKALNG